MSRRRPSDHLPHHRPDGSLSRRRTRRPSDCDIAAATALLGAEEWTPDDLAELREFLTCERLSHRADPEFQERLRMDLWWALLVERGGGSGRLPRA